MQSEVLLATKFLSEVLARRYEYPRTPEPDLVMDNPDNVREYRDAGLADGNGSSVYLFNLMLLCGAIKPGAMVVDLACGPANLLMELAKLNPQAHFVGVDLSPEMLRCAEDLRASVGADNVTFVQGDITQLAAFADHSADLVMSTLSLHHLPELSMLDLCFREIARIVRPGGAIHLMDFASLKKVSTAKYFAHERTKGLGKFLSQDYQNSLLAAYRTEDFLALLPILRGAVESVVLHKTFGVPFLIALTSLTKRQSLSQAQQRVLHGYWLKMLPSQRKDYNDMRLFFKLGGLASLHPRKFVCD